VESLKVLFSPSFFGSSHSGDHNFLFLVPVLQVEGICFPQRCLSLATRLKRYPVQSLRQKQQQQQSFKVPEFTFAAAPTLRPRSIALCSPAPQHPRSCFAMCIGFLVVFCWGVWQDLSKPFQGSKTNNCLSHFRTALGMTLTSFESQLRKACDSDDPLLPSRELEKRLSSTG
jgi:hypothetical protein